MRFPGALVLLICAKGIVAYLPRGSNAADGMPRILISGDCELHRAK
jgi:hypothetical protein